MITVLYICHDDNSFGGAALSLENMINSVRKNVLPIILFRQKCTVSAYFEAKGVKCLYSKFALSICEVDYELPFFKRWYSRISCYNNLKKNAKKVFEDIKDVKIDIVHSNSSVYLVGFFLSRFFHAKHVWHIREYQDIDQNTKPIIGWQWMKSCIRKSDYIIYITDAVRHHWNIDNQSNISVRWDAIRKQSETIYLEEKEPYFLFCSNFITQKKGSDIAVKAFAKSELWKKGYRLKMVGHTWENWQSELEQLIDHCCIKPYVDFLGPTNDVKSVMVKANAFLMCSVCEGLGRVTVEAMFYGCPVIGHNTGGTAEIIRHGETGFLYNTTEECADYMKQVVDHDMKSMIINAQQFAIKNFSEEEYGIFLMNIYRNCLNDKRLAK